MFLHRAGNAGWKIDRSCWLEHLCNYHICAAEEQISTVRLAPWGKKWLAKGCLSFSLYNGLILFCPIKDHIIITGPLYPLLACAKHFKWLVGSSLIFNEFGLESILKLPFMMWWKRRHPNCHHPLLVSYSMQAKTARWEMFPLTIFLCTKPGLQLKLLGVTNRCFIIWLSGFSLESRLEQKHWDSEEKKLQILLADWKNRFHLVPIYWLMILAKIST